MSFTNNAERKSAPEEDSIASATGAPGVAPRGRPRDERTEARIVASVMELLGQRGYAAVTFEEVARRAECSKATIYRRWSTKQEMVVAAVKASAAGGTAPPPVDSGTLRGDLLVLLERLETSMRPDAQLSLLLLHAGIEDPELCEAIEEAAGPTGARLPQNVLQAAVARGELPADADPFAYEEVAGATLLVRRLNGLTTDASYRELLVDHVLLPALKADGPAGQRGIFSGDPTPA
ncbi:MAG TPA: TetR/AcrR family transcriptional regulator [Ruania sp.]|nr:TetR/AcrR family transcriptional regulator [Ruania sp.]